MVRAAAKNHPSVAVVTNPAALRRRARGGRATAASRSTQRQRLAAEAFQHTAAYDVAVASWFGNVLRRPSDGTGFPALLGATWDKAAVLALRREPAPARRALHATASARPASRRPSSCTARRCRTTTTPTPTPPAAPRTTTPSRPSRSSSTPTPAASRSARDVAEAHRKAHACDPLSAFGGVIASTARSQGDGRAGRRDLHRGHRRARLRGRRGRGPRQKKNIRVLRCADRRARGGVESGRSTAARCCRHATGSTPRATTRPTGRCHRRGAVRRERSPTSPSPGGPAAR